MKKRMMMAVLVGSSLLVAQNSFASAVSITPRASVGINHYSLKWQVSNWGNDTGTSDFADVGDDLLTGGAGLTLAAGKFYFDASFEQTMEGSDDETYDYAYYDTDFDVFAYALTLGYNITGGLSVFAGWNSHETSFTDQFSYTDSVLSALDPLDGETEFSADGWFLGLSYGWNLFEDSTLSIKAAYALLDGDLTSRYDSYSFYSYEGSNTIYYSRNHVTINNDGGDATGMTIGVAWKSYLTDSLSYSITADWYKYTFDDFSGNEITVDWGYDNEGPQQYYDDSSSDVEEESYIFRFALSYQF